MTMTRDEARIMWSYYLAMGTVAALCVGAVLASKSMVLGPFTIPGGTLIGPWAYLLICIATLRYDPILARRIVVSALAIVGVSGAFIALSVHLPAAGFYHDDAAYTVVLSGVPTLMWTALFFQAAMLAGITWVVPRVPWSNLVKLAIVPTVAILVPNLFYLSVFWVPLLSAGPFVRLALGRFVALVLYQILCLPAAYGILCVVPKDRLGPIRTQQILADRDA